MSCLHITGYLCRFTWYISQEGTLPGWTNVRCIKHIVIIIPIRVLKKPQRKLLPVSWESGSSKQRMLRKVPRFLQMLHIDEMGANVVLVFEETGRSIIRFVKKQTSN